MMKYEFERIAGYEVSTEDYDNIIEPMYNATDLDKTDFVKCIDRKRFEVKREKSEERKQLEAQITAEIEELKEVIAFNKKEVELRKTLLSVEADPAWIKTWKNDISSMRKSTREYKARIAALKWVLE